MPRPHVLVRPPEEVRSRSAAVNWLRNVREAVGRGLYYTRDSGGEHETTPGEYVRWAQRTATRLGVSFVGTPERIEAMIREGHSQEGDLFLDYGVKGNQLQRPGLDALFRLALTDPGVTHIFIPRRDRFARPDDPRHYEDGSEAP